MKNLKFYLWKSALKFDKLVQITLEIRGISLKASSIFLLLVVNIYKKQISAKNIVKQINNKTNIVKQINISLRCVAMLLFDSSSWENGCGKSSSIRLKVKFPANSSQNAILSGKNSLSSAMSESLPIPNCKNLWDSL